MAPKEMKGPGKPLDLFSDYSNHESELVIKIKDKGVDFLEVFTNDDKLYMSITGRSKKLFVDNQGTPLLNIRSRVLNFGGGYQVFEGEGSKLPLFTIRNKWSFGGAKMVANFVNPDAEAFELHAKSKMLSNSGKAVFNGEVVARFEGGALEPAAGQHKSETIGKITIAPFVDVAVILAIYVCMNDIDTDA